MLTGRHAADKLPAFGVSPYANPSRTGQYQVESEPQLELGLELVLPVLNKLLKNLLDWHQSSRS